MANFGAINETFAQARAAAHERAMSAYRAASVVFAQERANNRAVIPDGAALAYAALVAGAPVGAVAAADLRDRPAAGAEE